MRLRELVPLKDPLREHDLTFDARFARGALEYLATPDGAAPERLAGLPAVRHLLDHAERFDQPVPRSAGSELVRHLLARSAGSRDAIARSLDFFGGTLLEDPRWVGDALRYLPSDFRFRGSLFLVAGYDIGVALAPHASLNAGHPHFAGDPRELLYYAIHELHHVGFMTYSPPPRIADLRTCADLVGLVDYSTALEGTAVLAALDRRSTENALDRDEDYLALGDERRMRDHEERYDEERDYLRRRGTDPVDDEALAVIERMSGGDRLWYRVGARMAMRIEQAEGRAALVARIRQGRDLRRDPRGRSAV
ncbi:MAG TPA: hypothetical protein VFA31_06800 [Candidatus Polarisedimenticolia bacterium]|nr:hypothetical protein [Candidatus Polarisedimenticolia bacterium]